MKKHSQQKVNWNTIWTEKHTSASNWL